MTYLARRERLALADLLDAVGPDHPTLCGDWTTLDLAAHLVVREARPDASVGIVVKPLAGWTDRVQSGAAKRPYAELVEAVRTGPPRLSAFSLPGVDRNANAAEYLVHHEDVRRAAEGWTPRELDPRDQASVWSLVGRMGPGLARNVKVGLTAVTPAGDRKTLKRGEPEVELAGDPLEILLFLYGRREHCVVELRGDPAAVRSLTETDLSV